MYRFQRFAAMLAIATTCFTIPACATPHAHLIKWGSYHSSYHSIFHSSHTSHHWDTRSSSGGISRPTHTASPTFERSSGGISRPVHTTPPKFEQSSGGISRPSHVNRTTHPGGVELNSNGGAVDRIIAKGHSAAALAKFRNEQAKFKTPPVGIPANRQAARVSPVWQRYGHQWKSASDYFNARQRAIADLPPVAHAYWTRPPSYVIDARPSYGNFSGAFLGSLLAVGITNGMMRHSYAEWAYSHRDDSAYQQWYADMQQQAQTNADLREKLAVLNAQVAQLQADHAPISTALPTGVDPSLLIAPSTVLQATAHPHREWGRIIFYTMMVLALIAGLGFVIVRRARS